MEICKIWLLPYSNVTLELYSVLQSTVHTAAEQLPDYFPNVRTSKKAHTQFLVICVYN